MTFSESVLSEKGYFSEEEMLKDVYFLNALSKIEQYKAEVGFFEKKYKTDLKSFEKMIHKTKGKEDFIKENDLDDWVFAISALKWWSKKAKEIKID